MKTYHATFDVDLSDIGLTRTLARSVARVVSSTSGTLIKIDGSGRQEVHICQVEVWATEAQLDEVVAKLRQADIKFDQTREPYTPSR